MKVVRVRKFGSPPVFDFLDTHIAEPGPHQVKIRVYAAGINPVESYIASGNYEFFQTDLPFTPGFDAAGIVLQCGDQVTDLNPGDRVYAATFGSYTTGTYAEALLCDRSSVHRLPDRLSYEQGAAIGIPFRTAVRALVQRGGARSGETVLVHGASGGVGLPTVQLAVALGLRVIGTAGTAAGLAAVEACGATWVLNHREHGYLDAIARVDDGAGPDLIIEMLANENLQADVELVRSHTGRVIVVGSRGPLEFMPRSLMIRDLDVRGTAIWNMTIDERAQADVLVNELLASGSMTPVVGSSFPLADVAEAVSFATSGSARGKVVLTCTE